MYAPPSHGLLVFWHMPVLPGGLQVEEVVAAAEVDELEPGQHWLLASPGQ